jgi:hypothetical protein
MTDPSTDVLLALDALGTDRECPMCQTHQWEAGPANPQMPFSVLVCRHCGFVRMHDPRKFPAA